MSDDKNQRKVILLCPTCGGTHFEFTHGSDETIELAKCVSCGRQLTKDELIHENSENISEHAKELGKEVAGDLAKKFKESLKKMFRGNKNIRIE